MNIVKSRYTEISLVNIKNQISQSRLIIIITFLSHKYDDMVNE